MSPPPSSDPHDGGAGTPRAAPAAPPPGVERPEPTISLIVPVLDAAAHLPALLSMLTREARPEVELILVDDASTDDTPALLEAFRSAQTAWSVQVVTLTENGGAGIARRAGFALARGRFLMWLDSDDEPTAGALDLALAAAATSEPGTILVFGYRYCWKDRPAIDNPGMTTDRIIGFAPAVSALLRRAISPYMWNKLVPREGVRAEHFATRRNGQDWLTLVNFLAVYPRVQRVPTVLVDYIQKAGTLSRSTDLLGYSSPDDGLAAQMRARIEAHDLWHACQDDFLLWYGPRIAANTALASARRDDPGPDDTLPQVAANVRQQLPLRQLLRALVRGDRVAAAALCLLRLSPRLFRRAAR